MKSVLADRLFHLKENGTTVRRECFAGLTTFVTMAYILAVNPAILGAAGMDRGAVFTASALAACAATLLMALLSNYPFALPRAWGLNAYFAYTVVSNRATPGRWPWLRSSWRACSSLSSPSLRCGRPSSTPSPGL